MSAVLKINPPKIIPWLSREEKKRTVLLVDLEADLLDNDCLRLDLDVVFNPLSIKRGIVTRADYYVGSTGAEITVEATGGSIREFTQAQTLDVNYSNVLKRHRNSSLSLNPGIKVKQRGTEHEAKLGSIAFHAGAERIFSAAFKSSERFLAPLSTGNEVKWTITLPRGEKIIRDFLIGNLYLYAECSWDCDQYVGRISLRPSDVRFFDADRRPIGLYKSLLMRYTLWRKGVKILYSEGLDMSFSTSQD